jgi:hypothetical protein
MNNKIDIIYDAMGALIKAECWEYLSARFSELTLQAWRLDFDILTAYATITLPVKSKISNRKMFMDKCKELYPHDDWSNLE